MKEVLIGRGTWIDKVAYELIERERSFGGDIIYISHEEVGKDFRAGVLHPLDLKIAVGRDLNKLIKPIREHFERNKKAKILYETVKKEEITR